MPQIPQVNKILYGNRIGDLFKDFSAGLYNDNVNFAVYFREYLDEGYTVSQAVKMAEYKAPLFTATRDRVINSCLTAAAYGYGILPEMVADTKGLQKKLLNQVWSSDNMKLSAKLHGMTSTMRTAIVDTVNSSMSKNNSFMDLAKGLYDGYGKGKVIYSADMPGYITKMESLAKAVASGDNSAYKEWQKAINNAKLQIANLSKYGAPNQALKAAYSDVLQACQELSVKGIDSAIYVAIQEKSRYYAERIGRTEMSRAHTDGVFAQFADADCVIGYRWTLGTRHVGEDICDFYANADFYGLGKGVYPKGQYPNYPAHPHCGCYPTPVFDDEIPEDGDFKFDGDAGKEYLESLDKEQQQALLGVAGQKEFAGGGAEWHDLLNDWEGIQKTGAGIDLGLLGEKKPIEINLDYVKQLSLSDIDSENKLGFILQTELFKPEAGKWFTLNSDYFKSFEFDTAVDNLALNNIKFQTLIEGGFENPNIHQLTNINILKENIYVVDEKMQRLALQEIIKYDSYYPVHAIKVGDSYYIVDNKYDFVGHIIKGNAQNMPVKLIDYDLVMGTKKPATVLHKSAFTSVVTEPALPEISQLTKIKDGSYLGGAGVKDIYVDKQGNEYIFKKSTSKNTSAQEPFRAYVQQGSTELSAKLFDAGEFIQIKAVEHPVSGEIGSLQKLMTVKENKIHLNNLTSAQIEKLQKEHLLDWTIANFDAHGKNFIIGENGILLGVDKEQAFRYLSAAESKTMSYMYHPNAIYGELAPVYNELFEAFAKGQIDLNLNAILPQLQRLEAISAKEYREMWRPYAEALHGQTKKAESLLNDIVARKEAVRAEYEKFFTQLLKERDATFSGAFKFLDTAAPSELQPTQLAAKALSKADLEAMTQKSLVEMCKAQGIKYSGLNKAEIVEILHNPSTADTVMAAAKQRKQDLKKSVVTKAAKETLNTSAIFDDFSLLPIKNYGISIRKDGGALEGQTMNLRRIRLNSKDGYQLRFKITEQASKEFSDNILKHKATTQRYEYFSGAHNLQKGFFDMSRASESFGYCSVLVDGDVTIKFVSALSDYRALVGTVDITVTEANGKIASEKIKKVLDKLNMSKLYADVTAKDDSALRMARLLWQHNPKAASDLVRTGKIYEEKYLAQELKKIGIDKERIAALVEKEVYPGYTTFYDAKIVEEIGDKVNFIFAGVGSSANNVAVMLSESSPGLMSSVERRSNGIFGGGKSVSEDYKTGGADNAFVRLVPKNINKPYSTDSFAGSGYRFIYDKKLLGRTDWYAYTGDKYGTTKGAAFEQRNSVREFIDSIFGNFESDNEIMFRKGIGKEFLSAIHCDSESMKDSLIAALKGKNMHDINGVPIGKFIIVKR